MMILKVMKNIHSDSMRKTKELKLCRKERNLELQSNIPPKLSMLVFYWNYPLVDKLFKVPVIISTCFLALSHGSNEVNVSVPSAAMIFMLQRETFKFTNKQIYPAILIGLSTLIVGFLTLGKRYLHKYRKRFLKIPLSK